MASLNVNPTSYNITDINQNTVTVSFSCDETLTDIKLSMDNGSTYINKISMTQTSAIFDITGKSNSNYSCKLKGYYEGEEVIPPPVVTELVIKSSNNLIKAEVGETRNIIPVLSKLDYQDKNFTYSSTDTNIATVNQEGLITIKSLGTCKVKATHTSTNTIIECTVEGIVGIPSDVEKTPISLGAWIDCGLGWMGEEDVTKDTAVKTDFIPFDSTYPIEFTLPTGIVWSKVHFYAEDKTVLTNEVQGLFCGNDVPQAGTLKMFKSPKNAKFFRVSICGADYNIETARFRANELVCKKVLLEPTIPYDKYKSNGVILNARHRIMSVGQTYQLSATETPIEATNGISYTSTDTNIATVNSSGLITAKTNGTCNIQVTNRQGETELVEIIVKDVVNTGTQLTSLASAIQSGNESTGDGITFATTSATVSSATYNPIIRNATFAGTGKTILTLSTGSKNITFEDCIFDNVCFFLANTTGVLKFVNCEFKNWQTRPIITESNDAKIECVNTTFKDAKPNRQEWITNTDWIRFHGYNPIEVTANNVSVKVNKCTFNNIMARCLVHWQAGYTGGVVEFNDNTIHTTEGHCLSMESPCSGNALRNHFSFIGELRGAFGEESLVGEDEYYPNCFGVGGNAIYSHVESANYCDLVANYNKIRYAMENGIEGGFKEIAYNYIEYTGYRYSENYDNFSMEGIWGSARNGIHNNVIINPNMDGIRIQYHGKSSNKPCNIHNNIMVYNNDVESKSLDNCGISTVAGDENNDGINTYNNTIIGFKTITKIDNGNSTTDFDLQTSSEYAYSTDTTDPPVDPPVERSDYFDFNDEKNERLVFDYGCTHSVDTTNKTVTVSSDFSSNYYGYLTWDIGRIREGRRYRLTCKSSSDKTFIRFRVNEGNTNNDGYKVEDSFKTSYSIDFTGVNTNDRIVDICFGIRNAENIGEITSVFSEIKLIDLDGDPPPLPSKGYEIGVKDYKIIVKQNGVTESYHSASHPPQNLNGNGGIDGYIHVMHERERHYLSLTRGACNSQITINGMKPFNYTYIDQAFKATWSNRGYAVHNNTLKFTIANRVDRDEHGAVGVTDDRTINPKALTEGLRYYNCALPEYMEITEDPNSINSVSDMYHNDQWLGVCRLTTGAYFHIHQNVKWLGGFNNASKGYIQTLVHELGHTTGIWDHSPHRPTIYDYTRELTRCWLEPSDIAGIQDKFPHLTGKSTRMKEPIKTDNDCNIAFSYPHYKDENDMRAKAYRVCEGEYLGVVDKVNVKGYMYNIHEFLCNDEIIKVNIHESFDLGLVEGAKYRMYLNEFDYLLNPKQAIIRLD